MSADEGADLAANSWPGFVDILSAVVIMFVFFVLVTASALYFHVITYTSKVKVEGEVQVEVDETPIEQVVDRLKEENSTLKTQLAGLLEEIRQTDAQFRESGAEQEIEFEEDDSSLVIFYGQDSITLTEETRKVVKEFIAANISKHGVDGLELVMSASKNKRSPIETISRKVAIARLMNVRNEFLETDLDKDAIFVKVENPTEIKGQYDWAKLQFRKATK
ncbi:MAG: hypothetical protein AB8B48_17705 [Pseudomonadales bacterium]